MVNLTSWVLAIVQGNCAPSFLVFEGKISMVYFPLIIRSTAWDLNGVLDVDGVLGPNISPWPHCPAQSLPQAHQAHAVRNAPFLTIFLIIVLRSPSRLS